jgi:hypothetical protein
MAAKNFKIEDWEANLPACGGKEKGVATGENPNSIHSRPDRWCGPTWGPGAVVRDAAGGLVGVRGSFEGPPFVGKTYDITSDAQADQREGETNQGRWTCLEKTPMFSVLKSVEGGQVSKVGYRPDQYSVSKPDWFTWPGDSYMYKEVVVGGRRTRRGSRKSRTRRARR